MISSGNSTITAISTSPGQGAIAVIRLSGPEAITIAEKIFKPKGKRILSSLPSHSSIFGIVCDGDNIIDEVVVSVFKSPNSYTGEDVVEISCHGSLYIQQNILELLIRKGAAMASPGEFTLRAFLNKKLDLAQAEAVADLISANAKAAHDLAIKQMRGGFSSKIAELRAHLVRFSALIELELDFGEEDVEFVKRPELLKLLAELNTEISQLIASFSLGNVMKHGIPVAIVGKPNVGKSTLLNILLNEDRALVSEIPGTTRDAIEDVIIINGTAFRFIDTAGLREARDTIEKMGIERTYEKIELASIVLYVFDISISTFEEVRNDMEVFSAAIGNKDKKVILVANMIDKLEELPKGFKNLLDLETIFISAKKKENITAILDCLAAVASQIKTDEGLIVSNARHYEALVNTQEALVRVESGIQQKLSGDLVAQDLREALYYLGLITGEIASEEILGSIFKNFCIGK